MAETLEEETLQSYESKKTSNETEIKMSKTKIKDYEAYIKVRETNIEFCDWMIEKLTEHIAEAKKDAENV